MLKVGAGRADLQLQFQFDVDLEGRTVAAATPERVGKIYAASLPDLASSRRGGTIRLTSALEAAARELLRQLGADKLAREIRVEWNPRLKTCAGRADYREKLISLNPRLRDHAGEVDRTLRHELAHLLAQWRAGRRRIAPHGSGWRQACRDLGIADEAGCHNLPFARRAYTPCFIYHCPNCREEFPRVRRVRRAVACLACCRAYHRGEFDPRFQLILVDRPLRGRC